MQKVSLKIFSLPFLFICNVKSEVSSFDAMRLATKLKPCVPVEPPDNLGDYLSNFQGTWHVVKLYGAPMREDNPIPPVVISKNPTTNKYFMEMDWPARKQCSINFFKNNFKF